MKRAWGKNKKGRVRLRRGLAPAVGKWGIHQKGTAGIPKFFLFGGRGEFECADEKGRGIVRKKVVERGDLQSPRALGEV